MQSSIGVMDFPGTWQLDAQTLEANANSWRIADGNSFDIEEGHFLVLAFVAQNFENPSATNPYMPLAYATEYGSNDDPNTIWYANNNGMVADISGEAHWIWTVNNFDAKTDQVVSFITGVTVSAAPVPEPATMLLLGTGLLGLAGISRKRKNDKNKSS